MVRRERESRRSTRAADEAVGLTEQDVMSAAEVARLLGCSTRQVYVLAEQDQLPGARRLGHSLLIVRPVLEHWLMTGSVDE